MQSSLVLMTRRPLQHFSDISGYQKVIFTLNPIFQLVFIYIYIYQISSSTIKHSTSIKTQDQIKTHLLSFNLFCFVFLFNLKLKLSHWTSLSKTNLMTPRSEFFLYGRSNFFSLFPLSASLTHYSIVKECNRNDRNIKFKN
jgi:hypothetical protein